MKQIFASEKPSYGINNEKLSSSFIEGRVFRITETLSKEREKYWKTVYIVMLT